MAASHAEHAKSGVEPMVVNRVVHCGQSREIDSARGIDAVTRTYRFEPPAGGCLFVTLHAAGTWAVKESLGKDVGGFPLISLTDVTAVVSATTFWPQMEKALATYFNAPVCEFRASAADRYVVKARPGVDAHAGE